MDVTPDVHVERILPFIKPIEYLLVNLTITDVMIDAGGRHVFVERAGTIEDARRFVCERSLKVALKNIACTCGDQTSPKAKSVTNEASFRAGPWEMSTPRGAGQTKQSRSEAEPQRRSSWRFEAELRCCSEAQPILDARLDVALA